MQTAEFANDVVLLDVCDPKPVAREWGDDSRARWEYPSKSGGKILSTPAVNRRSDPMKPEACGCECEVWTRQIPRCHQNTSD